MQPKEYLLQLVTLIEPYRKQWPEIKQALLENRLSNGKINDIIAIIEQQIAIEKDSHIKEKLQHGLWVLKKIQEQEKQQHDAELIDLEKMEHEFFDA